MKKKIGAIVIAMMTMMAMSIPAFADGLSKDGAVKKALNDAGYSKSQVKNLEVEYDKGDKAYEIEFKVKSNKDEYDYEIKKSGRINEKNVDYTYKKNKSKKKIGKNAARQKAAKHSGVKYSIVKKGTCSYKYKNKQGKYTVKFKSGHYKYEVEILAPTGKVIEYEYDYVK